MTWEPDYDKEKRRRLTLWNKLQKDRDLQILAQRYYAKNCLQWINDWCITFDPRVRAPQSKLMPFITFPRQSEFVDYILGCLDDKEGGLVEKSRDMGATWLCCAISVWLWLYRPGIVVGWGSRKEEYVDKLGDPKAIFPKLRQILENLPSWMKPADFKLSEHTPYKRVINTRNGSVIVGEAGDNMGRGGRTSIYFKDEAAHYDRPELIEAALGDNTDVQIDISSVNGSNNVFYRRRCAGQIWSPNTPMESGRTRVFIMDWRDHPNKTQEWYDKRKKQAEAEGLLHIFAQEVDRDYAGSVDRIIIKSEWIRASIDAHKVLGFSDDGEKVAACDIADGGMDKNAIAVKYGVVLKHIESAGGEAGEFAKIAVPICSDRSIRELMYDTIGVGAGFKTAINNLKATGTLPRGMIITPWNAGASPLDPDEYIIPNDENSPTNADQYLNLKAQSWFRLRTRFYKTFMAVKHGEKYNPAELISIDSSIPKLHELSMELTQATYDHNGKGKTIVDKKPDGASSPNLADSVVMCFNPTRELTSFDVL